MQVSAHSAVSGFCGRPQWCGSTDSKDAVGHKAKALMQEAQDAGLEVSKKTFGFMASRLAKGVDKADILAQLGMPPAPDIAQPPVSEGEEITVGEPVEVDVPPMNVTPETGEPAPGTTTTDTGAQVFAAVVRHGESVAVSAGASDDESWAGAAYSSSLSIVTVDASMSGRIALDLLMGADDAA